MSILPDDFWVSDWLDCGYGGYDQLGQIWRSDLSEDDKKVAVEELIEEFRVFKDGFKSGRLNSVNFWRKE